MSKRNTILLICCLIAILLNLGLGTYQRESIKKEILQSNIELKKSNDSLITVIKDFVR